MRFIFLELRRARQLEERVLGLKLAGQRSQPELCGALLNLNEFAYMD